MLLDDQSGFFPDTKTRLPKTTRKTQKLFDEICDTGKKPLKKKQSSLSPAVLLQV